MPHPTSFRSTEEDDESAVLDVLRDAFADDEPDGDPQPAAAMDQMLHADAPDDWLTALLASPHT